MAKTCSNGHVNDDANRFCDQCGEPLQQAAVAAAPEVAAPPLADPSVAGTASATSVTCPACGQENIPGTAFCDNCGAPLPPPQPAAAIDAAAQTPAAADAGLDPSAAAGATLTCAQCGAVNDAANRFCDNCGAELAAVTSPPPDAAAVPALDASPSTPLPTEGTVPPVLTQAEPTPSAGADLAEAPAAPALAEATAAPPPADTTTSAPTAVASAPTAASAASSADRQQLEEQLATQQRVVTQLEQTQQTLGAATPPAILQALDEARARLAEAEQALHNLPSAPAVDPAEVARLEEQLATQQRVVTQLEQTQQTLGAATPPAILQALDEARARLAEAEQALSALTGGAPAAPPQTPPSAPAQPTQPATEGVAKTYEDTAVSTPAPSEAAPVATPAPALTPAPSAAPPRGTDQLPPAAAPAQVSGPRFVARDGKAITLPRTGGDIVIGREDPISGIHPDIDLTPFGGEAGGVSRRHAVLQEQAGQWLLSDLDSTNYTRVDGNRIAPNTPTALNDGARLQFGRVEFEFRIA